MIIVIKIIIRLFVMFVEMIDLTHKSKAPSNFGYTK